MSSTPATHTAAPRSAPESTEKPLVPAKERFFYLDAMKGLMILWGIPVHACTVSGSLFFKEVAEVSGWVRMEAFFIISGFLSYMLVKRYGAGPIMARRTVGVGIPLLTVLVLLNPLTNYLILIYHNGAAAPGFMDLMTLHLPAGLKGTSNWHLHVWFLIVLLIFGSVSGPAIRFTDKVFKVTRSALKRLPDELLLTMLYVAIALCTLVARVVYEVGVKDHTPDAFHYIIRSTGLYISFFVLGMGMFASPRLMRVIASFHWLQFAGCGLLLLGARLAQPHLPDRAGEILRLLAESCFAVVFASVIFAIFKKYFSAESKVLRFIADAAFSIYLLHYLVIYLSAFAIRTFVKDDFTLSLLVTLSTTVVTALAYEFGIRRSTLLRCLFLGKIPKRKSAAAGAEAPASTLPASR